MSAPPQLKPLIVLILDGWGINAVFDGNAIAAADTPTIDMMARHYPTAAVQAAGVEVGLPWGEVGNSETGHRTIGTGSVYYQPLPRINQEISLGNFQANPVLLNAIAHAQKNKSSLHIMGLASNGGVHAHIDHLSALLEMCKRNKMTSRVFIHMFTDGRDTPAQSGVGFVDQVERMIAQYRTGVIASVTGRLYAMDRNSNWDRTRAAYDMLVRGVRTRGASSARQALESAYAAGLTDETVTPTPVTKAGEPVATISDGDSVIFFNYRPDRARQLTAALSEPSFDKFPIVPMPNLYMATMTQYSADQIPAAAFLEAPAEEPLAKVISDAQLSQFHIAETEKYAHVTYYLNGGHETLFPGEVHKLIQSSSTLDFSEEPRMRAQEITDVLVAEIESNAHHVYFANFANADMVGHTGNFEAAIQACSFLDRCIGQIWQAVLQQGGQLFITADHGNAEEMKSETGKVEKDHTSNPVPVYYVHEALRRTTPRMPNELAQLYAEPIGVLADIAPTILDILKVPTPATMTGISLLNSLR